MLLWADEKKFSQSDANKFGIATKLVENSLGGATPPVPPLAVGAALRPSPQGGFNSLTYTLTLEICREIHTSLQLQDIIIRGKHPVRWHTRHPDRTRINHSLHAEMRDISLR